MDSQEWWCDPFSEEKAVPISLGCEPDPIPTPIPDTMPDIVKQMLWLVRVDMDNLRFLQNAIIQH